MDRRLGHGGGILGVTVFLTPFLLGNAQPVSLGIGCMILSCLLFIVACQSSFWWLIGCIPPIFWLLMIWTDPH